MAIMAVSAAVGAGAAIKNGMDAKAANAKAASQNAQAIEQQGKANAEAAAAQADALAQQKAATATSEATTAKQMAASEQAINKASQKSPDTSAILSAASQAGKGGASGTMLTGAQGIDPNLLNLGKNTLLGA
jgi:hypothetical protein